MKKILLFIVLIFACNVSYGADVNFSLEDSSTTSYTNDGSTSGASDLVKDDDTGTACTFSAPAAYSEYNGVIIVDFGQVVSEITTINASSSISRRSGGGSVSLGYYDGSWHDVFSGSNAVNPTVSGNWSDVSKIRIKVINYGFGPTGYFSHSTKELRGIGPVISKGGYSFIL